MSLEAKHWRSTEGKARSVAGHLPGSSSRERRGVSLARGLRFGAFDAESDADPAIRAPGPEARAQAASASEKPVRFCQGDEFQNKANQPQCVLPHGQELVHLACVSASGSEAVCG